MSPDALRQQAKQRIDMMLAEHRIYCAERVQDTLDQLRLNQGIAKGLAMARDAIDETYRAMTE